jgi:hypothetical protein
VNSRFVQQPRRRTVLGAVLSTVALVYGAAQSHAAIEEIEATGRYYLGDNDTRLDGRRLALMEAKRNALEKAGTYVESITEVKDFQLTRDDIRTYTAGVVEVNETEEPKWEMVGQQLRCTVTVKVRVDKDVVTQRIAALRQDKEATKELKDARAKTLENEKKVAELNRELKKAKKGSPAAKRAKESRDNALAGIDSATLRAQAAAAATFSKQSWESMRGYVNRNVNLKGCMPFKTAQTAQGAAVSSDAGLLIVTAPALVFATCRPIRRRRTSRKGAKAQREREGT